MKDCTVVFVYVDGHEIKTKGSFDLSTAEETMERYWNRHRGSENICSIQVRDKNNNVVTELEF